MSTETLTEEITKTIHLPQYKCIMHDDNKTTMDFVINILMKVFQKELPEAFKLMMEIHTSKSGAIVGIYPLEHAEMRRDMTHSFARAQNFPLTVTIEPA